MGQAASGKEVVAPPVYFPKREVASDHDHGFIGQLRKELVSMVPSLLLYAVASWFLTRQVNKFLNEMNGNTSGNHIALRKALSEKLKNQRV